VRKDAGCAHMSLDRAPVSFGPRLPASFPSVATPVAKSLIIDQRNRLLALSCTMRPAFAAPETGQSTGHGGGRYARQIQIAHTLEGEAREKARRQACRDTS